MTFNWLAERRVKVGLRSSNFSTLFFLPFNRAINAHRTYQQNCSLNATDAKVVNFDRTRHNSRHRKARAPKDHSLLVSLDSTLHKLPTLSSKTKIQ